MGGGFAYAALATRNVEFYGDRVFDPAAVGAMRPSLQAVAAPWLHVHKAARDRGLRLMTSDRVDAEGIDPRQVLLIAYDWTRDAERLISQGARPAVLISFEPPVIAWRLHYDLERLSDTFPHTF